MYARIVTQYRSGIAIVVMASTLLNLLVFSASIYILLIYDSVIPSHSTPTLLGLFLLLALLFAFQTVFQLIRARALLLIGNSFHAKLSPSVHYAAVNQPMRSGPGDGDGMQPLRDLDQVHAFLIGNGPVAFIDLPWVVVFLLVLFVLHFWLGMTALFGVAVLGLLTLWTNRAMQEGTREVGQIASRRSGASGAAVRHNEATRAMGMQPQIAARSAGWNMQYLKAQSQLALIVAELGGIGRTFRIFLQSVILTVGALLVIDGKASGGIILASSVLAGRALAPVDQAIGSWRSFAAARAGWGRLTKVLKDNPQPQGPGVVLPPPSGALSVKDLWVAPPGSERLALRGVTFSLQPGEALGVIGPSAAGKTTLAKAILGIWSAARGTIRLDGATYDMWDRDTLGKSFGYVAQHMELFEGTIGDNIARFDPDASSEAIIAAAKQARMHELILGLHNGYETWVTNGGNELSAGQCQRLGLARALYGDPFLIVLDEPNSNLDAEGDAALAQAIANVRARGGIVVMITHRASALAPTSHLLVLSGGQAEAFGDRDTVLAKLAAKKELAAGATQVSGRPEWGHTV